MIDAGLLDAISHHIDCIAAISAANLAMLMYLVLRGK
jgi:hypothetical protein